MYKGFYEINMEQYIVQSMESDIESYSSFDGYNCDEVESRRMKLFNAEVQQDIVERTVRRQVSELGRMKALYEGTTKDHCFTDSCINNSKASLMQKSILKDMIRESPSYKI